jgi:hypothetical protein
VHIATCENRASAQAAAKATHPLPGRQCEVRRAEWCRIVRERAFPSCEDGRRGLGVHPEQGKEDRCAYNDEKEGRQFCDVLRSFQKPFDLAGPRPQLRDGRTLEAEQGRGSSQNTVSADRYITTTSPGFGAPPTRRTSSSYASQTA